MRGVVLDSDSLHPQDLDFGPLRESLPDWRFYAHTAPQQTAQRIADADVVVTNKVALDAGLIEAAARLKLICIAATGTDKIDLTAARRGGVAVSNVRAYATASVAEHVFALLLTLVRQLDAYRRLAREGEWSSSPHFCAFGPPIGELAGMTLGIVGYGELGRAVARLGEAFGMRPLIAQRPGAEPRAGRLPLDELLTQVDVLSLHCPLTPTTRHLLGDAQLQRMKPGAFLINTARGGIVDEAALLRALRDGPLGGAALDVLDEEPPGRQHPLLNAELANLIVTPHVAWASQAARQRLVDEIAANIRAFLNAEARNLV